MEKYIIVGPQRTVDGAFLISLHTVDGDFLADGEGETLEDAIEDAKSKL